MAAFYLTAGIVHLVAPDKFLPIVPDFLPLPLYVLGCARSPAASHSSTTAAMARWCNAAARSGDRAIPARIPGSPANEPNPANR
jgi:hypothetical protein